MVRTVIEAFPKTKRVADEDTTPILNIAECFTDTIQGENKVGVPCTFLRMQGCTLNCVWCDTQEVWRQGNPYSVKELLKIFDETGVIDNLKKGQHLVLTGGSPIKQQDALVTFIKAMEHKYKFKPIIEVENECTLMPSDKMFDIVDLWNCSPKLTSSGMPLKARYHPEIISKLATKNANFKFVITSEADWEEIDEMFIESGLISKEQVVLMPEGMTREALQQHYDIVVEMACKYNVRMTDRLHVTIWNKKTGV